MLRSMAQAVSALGITRLVLAVFDPDENEHGSVRVTFLWDKAKGISDNHPQKRFDPIILLPDSLWSSLEEKYLFVVELSYLQRSYGLLILELAWAEGLESVRWIDNIRTSLTMAIQKAKTHQQLIESRAQAETGRQAAEEADRLKSSFLTMVSHDLRTPLNVISGLSENLLSNIQGLDLKEEKQMVSDIEFIQSSARHLDSLLKDVLDPQAASGGQLVLEAENLDVRSEIDPVLQLGKRMATEKGLTWEAALPLSIPPIFFDRVRLRQILINLISNAVKFTRHGFVRVEVEITGPMVVFHVKDSGLGVPPEDQEAIFNEFRRSKRAITRGIGGMGMGGDLPSSG